MLWSPAILLLFVGIVFADTQYGWQNGKEYTYKVRSRTMASYNLESNHYAGILMEAYLSIQPNSQDTLIAKISQPRYSQIHMHLDNGWDSKIPQNHINLQTYPLSGKPFEIKIKNGVVRDLIIEKDVPTWEVNVIKSVVGQLQIDTTGENVLKSKHNQLPEGDRPYAMFKVMEDSVGGKCEVLYDISVLPGHVLQKNPELVPVPALRQHGEFISVVKTKNYTNCDQRVSYHHGIDGRNKWEPGSNDNGKYVSRTYVSRTILSGNLKKYTIQSSVGTNKVMINPDQKENSRGIVVSKMNLTLHEVKDISEQIPIPSNAESTGNLVYNYNNPFESESSRRPNKVNDYHYKSGNKKHRYSEESDTTDDSSDSTYDNDDKTYLQRKPKLMEAPRHPMLPYFIGNHGSSIQKNNKVPAVKTVNSIAQQIGNEMQIPNNMPEEQTLEKYTILYRLIRTMDAEQIAENHRNLYEPEASSNQLHHNSQSQNPRRSTWIAFRDAVAQAGTGPALVNIKQWIKHKQIEGREAAHVIDTLSKFIQTPTPEYMDLYFDLVTMPETKVNSVLHNSAVLSFSDVIRHAVVDKKSAHNYYPVHTYGKFFSKNNRNLHEKYIPYLIDELQAAIKKGDSPKIQTYMSAFGRIAHPRILSVFEPYLEGRKQISPYQRLYMVLSLYKLASIYPNAARSVLYKIYSNTGENHEIRTAAVYLLMLTNPPVSMLQRIADYTNYDSSKHVNSAVKSIITSLAHLQGNEASEISNAAKAALPLLISETYGPQYSRAFLTNYVNPVTQSGFSLETYFIGSDDSIIPKNVNIGIIPTFKGFKAPKLYFGGSVSSVQNLWNFVQQKLLNKYENSKNKEEQHQKYTPENISKILKIIAEEPEQIEGFGYLDNRKGSYFFAFDNHTLEQIPKQLKQLNEEMLNGMNFEGTKFGGYELTMSFPMESGYPFLFTLEIPQLVSVNGNSKLNTVFTRGSSLPESASLSGKVRLLHGMKMQKRFGFITPFEGQEYLAGIDRNVQFYLPVNTEISYDGNKQKAYLKLQLCTDEPNYKILQYTTQPLTAKYDILSLQTVSKDRNTHTIYKDRAVSSEFVLNDKNNKQRLQFKWEKLTSRPTEKYDNKYENTMEAVNKLANSMAALCHPNDPEKSEYENYSVKVSPDSSMSAELTVSYGHLITENENKDSDATNRSPKANAPHLGRNKKTDQRKQELLKEVSKNINSAMANAIDINFKLNGGFESSIDLVAAYGKSNVDEKSRALLYASANTMDGQNYYVSAGFEGKTPSLNTLDYEETLKANTQHEYDAEIHYGDENTENSEGSSKKIQVHGKVKQTEERKNKIRQSHDALVCSEQKEKNGNKLSSNCQKVNHKAKSVNAGDFIVIFDDESPLKEVTKTALDYADKVSLQHAKKHKDRKDKSEKNKIKFGFEISPHEDAVDVAVHTDEGKTQYNIALTDNYNKYNDEAGTDTEESYAEMSQNGICNLDKSEVETFDNHRYPLKLGNCWHVVMTSYPKRDPDIPSQRLDIPENMRVTIMVKENKERQKEYKMTLGETEFVFFRNSSLMPHVEVNGVDIELSKFRSHKVEVKGEIIAEIYKSRDPYSLTLLSHKYSLIFRYDITSAQVEAGERYRNSLRGLCGDYDGEYENDQLTPKGCQLKNSEEFSATYALINDEQCEGPARQNAEKARNAKCYYQYVKPGNVISEREAGRESQQNDEQTGDEYNHCTTHRTKVMRLKDEICFSIRQLPVCSSHCSPASTVTKKIPFHCVAKTSESEKVAQRVEKGANPDLGKKSVSRFEDYQIPIYCKA